MTRYRIFPSIGIARLGEDPSFFLGSEVPGAGPMDLAADGTLTPVQKFKDASLTKVRKQGARFHLFESEDGKQWVPAKLPAGAVVTWSVSLVNKKSAIVREGNPPIAPKRPQLDPARASMVIDGGTQQISGANASSAPLTGTFSTAGADGTPYSVAVELGQLRTDAQGRLIVLGGKGFSSAPPGTPLGASYYRNPKWHDDVSDGPISAEIRLPGAAPIEAEAGAWVVVAPPDYAPAIQCVVALHDVIRQVGIDHHGLASPGIPSFDLDIAPLIQRVRRLQWVHDDATWSDVRLTSPKLRSRAAADQPLREAVRKLILKVETVFAGHTDPEGPPYQLRAFQKKQLNDWVSGDFDDTPAAPSPAPTADGLTRAALENAAGQGFCPGIEGGIIVLDPTLYLGAPFDFRIDHATLKAGDITALMAQPWQADFLKCNTEWWPTQRPDIAFQLEGVQDDWVRGAGNNHKQLVERSARLGFIVQQGAEEVFLEAERDPALPTS